MKVTAPL